MHTATLPDHHLSLTVAGKAIVIPSLTAADIPSPSLGAVNIMASGPSIQDIDFAPLLSRPTFFVNGSIDLLGQHTFAAVAGYVISDARFIAHQPDMIRQHYQGQPLYATQAVYQAMAEQMPELIEQYHTAMRLIFAVDRPPSTATPRYLKWLQKKPKLVDYQQHPAFIIDAQHRPQAIGVSLDMTQGFVEAGTVAYIAAQLAYTLGASSIHLYGIDLLNSAQPRFYEDDDNRAPCMLDKAVMARIVPSFTLLCAHYAAKGVDVVNHSPVSQGLFGSNQHHL